MDSSKGPVLQESRLVRLVEGRFGFGDLEWFDIGYT